MQRGGRRLPGFALIVAVVTAISALVLGTPAGAYAARGTTASPAGSSAAQVGAAGASDQPASGTQSRGPASRPQRGSLNSPQAGDPVSQQAAAADQVATGASASPRVEQMCGEPTIRHHVRCLAERLTDAASNNGMSAQATPRGYGPGDLHDAYKLPQGVGAGSVVAIVDAYDDPNAEADLNAYRAQYGLGACTTANGCFQKVDQRGGTTYPTPDSGWSTEISLDLDMVSAICPLCHILLVEGDTPSFDDLGKAVNEAVALGARFVSNSYGAYYDKSDVIKYNAPYQHPGTVITVSSGDGAYGVSWPASVPEVVSVGGTSLNRAPSSARGWSESAWSGAGSGCSAVQPKPAWQTDAGCSHRTVADVSAVADPNTGVAVYDSYGLGGWNVFGGTSVSAPVIASVYALNGIPAAGSQPASWPYGKAGALFDVTAGSNATCTPAYLCTAGPGYDGPTGLGTPNGIAAFSGGPHGILTGTVTDASTGKPLSLNEVDIGKAPGTSTRLLTDDQGHYSVTVPVGSYPVTVTRFGYADQSSTVQVSDGQTTTTNFALQTVPFHTVSGKLTDGSGHGWPLYAQLLVPGQPASTTSDAITGMYSLSLPVNHDWPLEVKSSYYPGYETAKATIAAGTGEIHRDFGLPIDANNGNSAIENSIPTGCTSPGYKFAYSGSTQTFNSTSLPTGWTVDDKAGNGNVWRLDDAQLVRNYTTDPVGTADPYMGVNLASSNVKPDADGATRIDTSLVSPVLDLTNDPSPVVEWDNHYPFIQWGGPTQSMTAYFDVSTDRGATWATLFDIPVGYFWETAHAVVQIPQAAGKKQVQVRFRYDGQYGRRGFHFRTPPDNFIGWQVDNVFVGNKSCQLSHGGLVAGHVNDKNTGAGTNQARVTVAGNETETAPAPADSHLGDGAYYAFAPAGHQRVTASMGTYHPETLDADVNDNTVTRADLALTAGRLETTGGPISVTEGAGEKQTATLTVKNTGNRPATVSIEVQPGGGSTTAAASAQPPDTEQPPGTAWQKLTSLHRWVNYLAAATDPDTGLVYSILGGTEMPGSTDFKYTLGLDSVYDPKKDTWHTIRQVQSIWPDLYRDYCVGCVQDVHMGAQFVDGKLYVVATQDGGESRLLSYNPRTDTWARGENPPLPRYWGASAVVNGKLYVVGGRPNDGQSTTSRSVQVYDPKTGHWSLAAEYPASGGVMFQACGGINGKLYCAGGTDDILVPSSAGYVYDPQSNSWSPIASMPIGLRSMAYTAANGKLLVSGGLTTGGTYGTIVTSQGFAYDPPTNAWTALPNNDQAGIGAAGACGFYRIGGSTDRRTLGSNTVEQLPGYTNCDGNGQASWLSVRQHELTLGPGETRKIKVTLDAGTVQKPGDLHANLVLHDNTPYDFNYVPVTLTVK